jgi:3-oxoacyl-[acyl-carrier-protein] synthase I
MSGLTRPMHIIAVGARTPVGLTAAASAAGVRAGISRLSTHPFMIDKCGDPARIALDGKLPPRIFGVERMVPLAMSALREVLERTGAEIVCSNEVFLALPECRPGFSDDDAGRVVDLLKQDKRLSGCRISIRGRGHAGGLQALATAVERLSAGRAEVCTVIGVDSYADPDTLDWLTANLQHDCNDVRGGFVPGEGAGALVLCTGNVRKYVGIPGLAILRGVHMTTESKLIKTDADVLGEGLSVAIAGAAANLRLPEEAVDGVYCDINGERYRSDEWGFAALRVGTMLSSTAYQAPADSWGDVGAASGVLGCILATRAWARGYAAGPRALVWASSEAGLRGAAILQRPEN